MNYNGRIFRTVQNTANGEVNQETIFKYFQKENRVWADYCGGGIVVGHLIAIINEVGNLEMSYHHINENNEVMTGNCLSKPEVLANGKLKMHEEWQWTCKDRSRGCSIIEEV
ncbi:n-acetylglutamate synthase [Paenibacillus sp. MMS18-CY102]|nr:n-acetylglutamate synthase [Paenibacillus sp. MMS18-CY102]